MMDSQLFLQTRPKFQEYEGQIYQICEIKEDGWRLTAIKRDGKVQAFSKKIHVDLWPKIRRNDKVRKAIENLPNNSIVDGEAHIPGGFSSGVPTALTTGEGWRFSTFALPYLHGEDCRISSLGNVRIVLRDYGFDRTTRMGVEGKVSRETLMRAAVGHGVEGFVLKLGHYSNWYRVKPKKTVDCIIMGMSEGTNRLRGSLGALKVGLLTVTGRLVEVASVGGGYSDEERSEFWNRHPSGEVCEVEYDSITSGRRLRFPQFVRLRSDKEFGECLLAQINQ